MATLTKSRNLEPVINAAQEWIRTCLIADGSVLSDEALWTPENVAELRRVFVEHPQEGKDDFFTKLKGQMKAASPSAKRLMAEMIWALLLFPTNIKRSTKRQHIVAVWSMSGEPLRENMPMLSNEVLSGIGSGGPGFNNHRWREIVFLILLVGDLKKGSLDDRRTVLSEYDAFIDWIARVPQEGHRQFRHMLRFFCFPDRVERMSSNGERRAVIAGFDVAPERETKKWSDRELDNALLKLRETLQKAHPSDVLDFYEEPLRDRWHRPEKESDDNPRNFSYQPEAFIFRGRLRSLWPVSKQRKLERLTEGRPRALQERLDQAEGAFTSARQKSHCSNPTKGRHFPLRPERQVTQRDMVLRVSNGSFQQILWTADSPHNFGARR
jgi:5-methylcytosine-specific restriction protein B